MICQTCSFWVIHSWSSLNVNVHQRLHCSCGFLRRLTFIKAVVWLHLFRLFSVILDRWFSFPHGSKRCAVGNSHLNCCRRRCPRNIRWVACFCSRPCGRLTARLCGRARETFRWRRLMFSGGLLKQDNKHQQESSISYLPKMHRKSYNGWGKAEVAVGLFHDCPHNPWISGIPQSLQWSFLPW